MSHVTHIIESCRRTVNVSLTIGQIMSVPCLKMHLVFFFSNTQIYTHTPAHAQTRMYTFPTQTCTRLHDSLFPPFFMPFVSTHTNTRTHMLNLTHTHKNTCTHLKLCAHIHMHAAHIHTHTVQKIIQACICTYTHKHMRTCIHAYIRTCIHLYMHAV